MKVRLSKCSISKLEIEAVGKVLEAESLGMGADVLEFELSIKKYLETSKDVVCVNSGTSALQLSLAVMGIKQGDEVLVPSLTYIASFQAISAVGATPVACEVNPETLFINASDAEMKITDRTKAIMPVHYASSSKGMMGIYDLAGRYNLRVVEDAAQAFGSRRNGRKIGVEGDIICFSFDGIKNITSGEGGAILSSDVKLLEYMRNARLLGVEKDTEMRYLGKRSWDFDVKKQGFRFHMSNINAAIGIEQLKKIDVFKSKRQLIVRQYISELSSVCQVDFLNFNFNETMPHIFVIKAENRDHLRGFLLECGIECGIHYKPNHLHKKYQSDKKFPLTESVYREVISLPCHVDLTPAEQCYVVEKIKAFYHA